MIQNYTFPLKNINDLQMESVSGRFYDVKTIHFFLKT